jgi:hypothetical protein
MCPTGRHDDTEVILIWSREVPTTKQQDVDVKNKLFSATVKDNMRNGEY